MDRVVTYLEAIEEISRTQRRHKTSNDANTLAQLESALGVAKAAWLLIPNEWQARLHPPPERTD